MSQEIKYPRGTPTTWRVTAGQKSLVAGLAALSFYKDLCSYDERGMRGAEPSASALLDYVGDELAEQLEAAKVIGPDDEVPVSIRVMRQIARMAYKEFRTIPGAVRFLRGRDG